MTGNEISSSRGLDRIFSLERLSLDENRIQSLANISGIAKIPFLMNFDIKGNPIFEGDGMLYINVDNVDDKFSPTYTCSSCLSRSHVLSHQGVQVSCCREHGFYSAANLEFLFAQNI